MKLRGKGLPALATLLVLVAVVGGAGTMGAALGEEAGAQSKPAAVEQVVPENGEAAATQDGVAAVSLDEGETAGSVPVAATLEGDDEPGAEYGEVVATDSFGEGCTSWWYTTDKTMVIGGGDFEWLALRELLHRDDYVDVEKVVFLKGARGVDKVQEKDVTEGIFQDLKSLTTVTGAVDGSTLQTAYKMFYGCSNLTSVDFTGWNLSNVITLKYMFYKCTSLKSVDISGLDFSRVYTVANMFEGCSALESIDLSHVKLPKTSSFSFMFSGCTSLETIQLRSTSATGETFQFEAPGARDLSFMFQTCSSLGSLDMSVFQGAKPTILSYTFSGCSSMTSLDLTGFDTSSVTDMTSTFQSCSSLKTLDVSGFNTASVTGMRNMFLLCSSVTTLDVSGFDTSKVRNMYGMFSDCSSLSKLDVSGFKTDKVESMSYMFYGCKNLSELDVSGFDTGKVDSTQYMFFGCSGLEVIDVSGFKLSGVKFMQYMFRGCSSVKILDLSGFDTTATTEMSYMFQNCSSLEKVDVSGFNTAKVTNMTSMFENCSSLTYLDLTGFDPASLQYYTSMLYDCSSLMKIKLGAYATVPYLESLSWSSRQASWTLTSDSEDAVSDAYTISGSTGLIDNWDPQTMAGEWFRARSMSITYISDFSQSSGQRTVTYDEALSPTLDTTTFTATGYRIDYWTDANGNRYDAGASVFDTLPDVSSITLTAHWARSVEITSAATITIAAATYNGSALEPAVTVTVNGEKLTAGTDFACVYSDNTSAGTATVVISGAGDYTGSVTKTFTISRRPVTLTSKSVLKTYDGEALESPLVSISGYGFVPGEATAMATGSITGVGNVTNTIEIVPGTGYNENNYLITKYEGTLTVTTRSVTLTSQSDSKLYDGTALELPEVEVGGDGFVKGEATARATGSVTNVGDTSNAIEIVAGTGYDENNYAFTYDEGWLTVEQRPVTLTSQSYYKIYDGTPLEVPEVTVGGDGFVEGEVEVKATGSITNVGDTTNTIEITPVANYDEENYDITIDEGTLTVGKRTVKLTSQSVSKVYDGEALEAPEVTVGGDEFVEGEATAKATGTITEVGSVTNTIEIVRGTNYRASNYTIRKDEGTLEITIAPVEMFRLYNPNSGEHFYTSSEVERDATVAAGWDYEGIGWTAPSISGTPVYRLYSGTDHHYTTSETERDALLAAGWTDEGIGWYSDDNEGVALYRQFNPYVEPEAETNNSGSHNFTTDQGENDYLVSIGWEEEGIAWYGMVVEEDTAE